MKSVHAGSATQMMAVARWIRGLTSRDRRLGPPGFFPGLPGESEHARSDRARSVPRATSCPETERKSYNLRHHSRCRSIAVSRSQSSVRSVISHVTPGCPSRSPPIHEPKRRNRGSVNSYPGNSRASAWRRDRWICGTTSHSRGIIERPRSTSSRTDGRIGRRNSVCHRTVKSARSRVNTPVLSRGNSSSRSSSSRHCRMRRSFARIDRRLASLG